MRWYGGTAYFPRVARFSKGRPSKPVTPGPESYRSMIPDRDWPALSLFLGLHRPIHLALCVLELQVFALVGFSFTTDDGDARLQIPARIIQL